jgi:N-acetylglutamate synthase
MNMETLVKDLRISPLTMADYEPVIQLWEGSEGVGMSGADEEPNIRAYLERNPGLSFVAKDQEGAIAAAVLAGHDGRRGFLHHLAVAQPHRRKGLGRSLVGRCLAQLQKIGIQKCHGFIFADNDGGLEFWKAMGWNERLDLKIISRELKANG